MKTNIILIILSISLFACLQAKHDGYTVNGEIKGVAEAKIVLSYFDISSFKQIKVDSAVIKDGKFLLKGNLDYPQQMYAVITPENSSFNVWLENKEISIKGDISKVKINNWGYKSLAVSISGSTIQDEFDQYNLLLEPINKESKPFSDAYDKANQEYIAAIKAKKPEEEQEALKKLAYESKYKIDAFGERIMEVNSKYMKSHPGSFVTASLLLSTMSRMKPEETQKIFDRFSEEIKGSYLGLEIAKKIKKSIAGAPGSIAAGFSKNDINGKPISLNDFKGQYVLLDFWASWCGPCRAGNPHLIELYNKYHKKGIEFIGVANDDHNENAWRKAVKKDQIGIWYHVLAGDRRDDNCIGNTYAISTLPTKILIDPDGKIIGRYGSGGDDDNAMDEKLEEIFNK